MTGTEILRPVPGPLLDCLISGLPGSSNRWSCPTELGSPISGNRFTMFLPPRSNTRKISPGGVASQAGRGANCSKTPAAFISLETGRGFFISVPVPSRE